MRAEDCPPGWHWLGNHALGESADRRAAGGEGGVAPQRERRIAPLAEGAVLPEFIAPPRPAEAAKEATQLVAEVVEVEATPDGGVRLAADPRDNSAHVGGEDLMVGI